MLSRDELQRLVEFMQARGLDHKDLGRKMHFSPTYVFGVLGGAWQASDSFKWHFALAFGFEAAREVFAPSAELVAV